MVAHTAGPQAMARPCLGTKMAEWASSSSMSIWSERLWCSGADCRPQIYELITHSGGLHFLFMAWGLTRPRLGGLRGDSVMWDRYQGEGKAKDGAIGEQEEGWGKKPRTYPHQEEPWEGLMEDWSEEERGSQEGREGRRWKDLRQNCKKAQRMSSTIKWDQTSLWKLCIFTAEISGRRVQRRKL